MPRAFEHLDHLQAREDAEVAVVAPSRAHGVDVRAGHDRRQILPAGTCRDHVADLVDADFEAEVAHPGHDEIATLLVRVGERQPIAAAALDRPDLGQRFDPAQQASAVDPEVGMARLHQCAGSEKARTSTRAAPHRGHRGLEQCLAALGRRARRIPDVTTWPEVVREPAEAHLAAELDVPVVGERLGHVTEHGVHVYELRPQVQDQRGLVDAAVHPHPPFVGGIGVGLAALVGRHERVGEERHEAIPQPQLAAGDVEQRRVAAVAVEEHDSPGGQRRQRPPDVVEHREQRAGRQPHRARGPRVLIRLGVGERWEHPQIEVVTPLVHDRVGHLVGDDEVSRERQMGSVLLDGSERLDEHRVRPDPRGHLGSAEVGEVTVVARHHRHRTGVGRCDGGGRLKRCITARSSSAAATTA